MQIQFNESGLIPPFIGDPTESIRSPYRMGLADFVDQFATTVARREVLAGLLRYRQALHAAGFSQGFQWLDGSFVEDCERVRGRAPGDIDVVSFVVPDPAHKLEDIEILFDADRMKEQYKCDAYGANIIADMSLIDQCVYWYSLFAHRRDSFE